MVLLEFGAFCGFFSEEVLYCLEYSSAFPHGIICLLEEIILQKGILKKVE